MLESLRQKFETLGFAVSEFFPVFFVVIFLVVSTKCALFFYKSSAMITWAQLGFYSVSGVLVGYVENITGAKIGGLLPSAIVIFAFLVNSYLRMRDAKTASVTLSSPIYLSAAIAGISFMLSARYFTLLFD